MDINNAGRFRANPKASPFNAVRVVSETPGTVQKDTSAATDMSAATEATGVKYTGADGASQTILFGKTIHKTLQRINEPVAISEGADALRDAILEVVEQHEVDPIVTVEVSGDNWTISHVGAGTLSDVIVDGSDVDLTRAALS